MKNSTETNHLRFADQPGTHQRTALTEIVRSCAPLMTAFEQARALNLPDWWIVSGAIYNQVWNNLTGKPDLYGVKDIDLFYFDPDTIYAAEDRIIRKGATHFDTAIPVEIRNQARVHLWYKDHFGEDYAPLSQSTDGIYNFACKTHAIGMRLKPDDSFDIYAPFGLNDIFGFRLVPHTKRDNRATHEAKGHRQMTLWPELSFVPWPENPDADAKGVPNDRRG
ncbi:nucleotidyltransferase family protein [Cognatiyoonia sp. IB215446]|uniref:nucleotidyltransferase family protein n=1 Tax=Cognatiyoonia sp. IB215446 TaxID=3097355 RepID=UPI002A166BE4|nr:nucleotidyltransferase family protein [Cognatiyoonia sp. IB215446]MDX8346763.1 nucleotidyltransferase family protein [Cognatiyoonia sp. IB215446]